MALSVGDKTFVPFISREKIDAEVKRLARRVNETMANDFPLFLVVLNGAFMFAADLLREVTVPCEIAFVRLSSYEGTESSGRISEVMGFPDNVERRNVVIVEDVVDSGRTVSHLTRELKQRGAAKVHVATALLKPGAYKGSLPVEFAAFSIPDDFVIGYGMDYNGRGRNLKDIYVLAEDGKDA